MGLEEEIQEIEEEIASTPYNKSTEQHIGRLKSKLAKLKDELADRESGGGGGEGYAVQKTGDATVALVGFPSVGKSTLLNALTNAESETASYSFTTLEVVPGMLKHQGINVQLLDVPGLIEGASQGRGRGREVMSVLRSSDLLLFLVDVFEPQQYSRLREELYSNGIRMDKEPPDVRVNRKGRGGIELRKNADVGLDDETIREACSQHGIVNASVVLQEDVSIDELNDAILDNRVYVDTLVAVNKIDLADEETLEEARRVLREHGVDTAVGISAEEGMGLDVLKDTIQDSLDLVRVYLKPQGGEADMTDPLVLEEGGTVRDVAREIHREAEERFRYARVWGGSASHEGQQVGLDHVLEDEDVVSVVMRR